MENASGTAPTDGANSTSGLFPESPPFEAGGLLGLLAVIRVVLDKRAAAQKRHGKADERGRAIRGGEVGIRTLDALVGHTHLAGEHLRPLGHFSTYNRCGLL